MHGDHGPTPALLSISVNMSTNINSSWDTCSPTMHARHMLSDGRGEGGAQPSLAQQARSRPPACFSEQAQFSMGCKGLAAWHSS